MKPLPDTHSAPQQDLGLLVNSQDYGQVPFLLCHVNILYGGYLDLEGISQANELNESVATLNTNEVMSVVLIGQCSWHCRSVWVKMKNFSFHFERSLSFFFQSIPFKSGTCSSCLSIS